MIYHTRYITEMFTEMEQDLTIIILYMVLSKYVFDHVVMHHWHFTYLHMGKAEIDTMAK